MKQVFRQFGFRSCLKRRRAAPQKPVFFGREAVEATVRLHLLRIYLVDLTF